MLSLQRNHIIDLYCIVADIAKKKESPLGGRPVKMTDVEVVTILVWNVCVLKQKTIKEIHRSLVLYHQDDFKHIPKYSAFVDACHKAIPLFETILGILLEKESPIRIVDSTMIPVCKIYRSDRHKVAKGVAMYGKNHQGWHFGFKLHASVDLKGRLSQVYFTSANVHDAQVLSKILNKHARLAVGDGSYNASVMRGIIWKMYGCHVVAPPHSKQNKKVLSYWQHTLLSIRPRIETTFGYLKEHLHLITSFPRSIKGYLFHYLKTLVGYMFLTR